MQNELERVSFLARSKYRVGFLRHLYDQPLTWRELRSKSDASRVTLQRNLDTLCEYGWIRISKPRTYELTVAGRTIVDRFMDVVEAVSVAERFQPLLRYLPDDEFYFDIGTLVDAEITVADQSDPYAPINEQLSTMKSADSFKWLMPTVGLQVIRATENSVIQQHDQHEIIVNADVVERMPSTHGCREILTEVLEADHCEVYVSEKEIPFYLGLTELPVQLGVANDDGLYHAIVETRDDQTRDWAEEMYQKHIKQATPIEELQDKPTTQISSSSE